MSWSGRHPVGPLCGFLLWLASSIWKILQALSGPPAPCCLWTVIAQNLNWGLHLTPTLRAESCRFPAQPRPARPPPAHPAGLRGAAALRLDWLLLHCKPLGPGLHAHFPGPVGLWGRQRERPVLPRLCKGCGYPWGRSLGRGGVAARGRFPGLCRKDVSIPCLPGSPSEVLGQRLQPSLLEAEAV